MHKSLADTIQAHFGTSAKLSAELESLIGGVNDLLQNANEGQELLEMTLLETVNEILELSKPENIPDDDSVLLEKTAHLSTKVEQLQAIFQLIDNANTSDDLAMQIVQHLSTHLPVSYAAVFFQEFTSANQDPSGLLYRQSNEQLVVSRIQLEINSILLDVLQKKQPQIWANSEISLEKFFHIPAAPAGMIAPVESAEVHGLIIVQNDQTAPLSPLVTEILEPVAEKINIGLKQIQILETPRQPLVEIQKKHIQHIGAPWHMLGKNLPQKIGYQYDHNTINPVIEESSETLRAIKKGSAIIETSDDGAKTSLAAPIRLRGQTLGAIKINFNKPEAAQEVEGLVEQITERLALAMDNARLYQEATIRSEELNLLNQVATTLNASLNLQENLYFVAETLVRVLPIEHATLRLLNEDKTLLLGTIEHGVEDSAINTDPTPIAETPIYRQVISSRRSKLVENVNDQTIPVSLRNSLAAIGTKMLLVIPLLTREEVIGVVSLHMTDRQLGISPQEIQFAETIINQVATAIQNARLFERQQKRAIQLQTAAEVSQAASSYLDQAKLLPQIANLIKDGFNLYYVGIFLLDETRQWAVLRSGTGEAGKAQLAQNHKLTVDENSMIGSAIKFGTAQISQDVGSQEHRYVNPLLPETRSEIALPLTSRGQLIGAMTIQSMQSAAFSKDDITTLQTMANQLANAILTAMLFAQTQRQNIELAALNEMSRILSAQLDITNIAETVYEFTSRLMPTNSFFLALYDSTEEILSFPINMERGQRLYVNPMKKSRGLTQYVIDTKKPLLINENLVETINKLGIDVVMIGEPAKSWLGVPMIFGQEVIGVITNQDVEKSHAYTSQDRDVLVSIANQASIAIQNARLFQETQETLAETETLYEASAALNAAQSYQDAITVIQKHTFLGAKASTITIDIFDQPFTETQTPKSLEILARWTRDAQPGLAGTYSLADYPSAPHFMDPDHPTYLEDIATDPRIDEKLRTLFLEELNAVSTIFIPLKIRGQWIGYINGIFPEKIIVQPDENQRLLALASQTAIVIQALYQLNQIRERARREQILREITTSVHQAVDPETILRTAAEQVGKVLGRKTMIQIDSDQIPQKMPTDRDPK